MPTWTAPTTRSSGDLITASIWNTDLVSNLGYLKDAPVIDTAVILGAATTSGIRLDLESGTLAVREGDDSAYGPISTGALTVSTGRVLMGTTTARTLTTLDSLVQIETAGSTYQQLSLISNRNDTGGASIILGKSRGTAVGGVTVVNDGDNLGFIRFQAADGTDMDSIAAQILAQVDGSPGNNDTPGRLIFSTAADGAASVTEAMRIDARQNVGIGVTPSAWGSGFKQIDISATGGIGSDGNGVFISRNAYDSTGSGGWKYKTTTSAQLYLQQSTGGHVWYTAVSGTAGNAITFTERMGLTSGGNLAIGATAKLYLDGVAGTGDTYIHESSANTVGIVVGGATQLRLDTGTLLAPNVYSDTTASAANVFVASDGRMSRSTSSIRYKHDIVTLDTDHALSAVLTMRPVTYRGKGDADQRRHIGFIAEEMAEIAPLLATYDEGGESGTPNYVTYDRVTAYLVAAVQQQQAEIAALKARLN